VPKSKREQGTESSLRECFRFLGPGKSPNWTSGFGTKRPAGKCSRTWSGPLGNTVLPQRTDSMVPSSIQQLSSIYHFVSGYEILARVRTIMRIVAGCLLVAIGSIVLAPGSQELHNRYGEPDLERFTARPGISLTVQFGPDHLACQAQIEPPQSLIRQGWTPPTAMTLMSSEGVSQVLEEFIPVASRGKHISNGSFQSGCGVGFLSEYENVSIMRSSYECDRSRPDRDVSTSIIFKRDICPKIISPWHVEPTHPALFPSDPHAPLIAR